MNIWVQKNRVVRKDGSPGGHSSNYFKGVGASVTERRYLTNATRSPQCRKYIREELQPGDVLVLYQVEDRAVLGLARADSHGMETVPGSGLFDAFFVRPAVEGLQLRRPVTVKKLRARGCSPHCFGPTTQGCIFPMTLAEYASLVQIAAEVNPEQCRQLQGWLQ